MRTNRTTRKARQNEHTPVTDLTNNNSNTVGQGGGASTPAPATQSNPVPIIFN